MNIWPWEWQKTETEVRRQWLADVESRANGTYVGRQKEKDEGDVEHVSTMRGTCMRKKLTWDRWRWCKVAELHWKCCGGVRTILVQLSGCAYMHH